ncbi:hypothetical protein ACERK3_09455 [Phycisphaerales bacterium AB-hyl4]|uniref:Uncharacterized protein n=1 Tax=Natronomicrosphaera hydrolytica TaxID=3242702 RepID=A0ABV4U4Q4_9BACT
MKQRSQTLTLPDATTARVEVIRRYRSPIDGSERIDVRLIDGATYVGLPAEWASPADEAMHGQA